MTKIDEQRASDDFDLNNLDGLAAEIIGLRDRRKIRERLDELVLFAQDRAKIELMAMIKDQADLEEDQINDVLVMLQE
jgi:hypothetical protein